MRNQTVKVLCSHPSINVNARNRYGKTALMFAAQRRLSPEVLEVLCAHPDVDLNRLDNAGRTAMDHATAGLHPRFFTKEQKKNATLSELIRALHIQNRKAREVDPRIIGPEAL